jgi:peptidoglycan-N-acetylmuramic acid deacetylase
MKKVMSICLAVLMVCLLFLPASAKEEGRGWYIKRGKDHRQPTVDQTAERILEENGGYYVDKACKDSAEEKVLYLTFDAGFENGNVAKILDILKEENVKGAFFVLSHLVRSNTELLRRMNEEGHLICNHTDKHKDPTKITQEELEKEIHTLETLYTEITGKELAPYFRPPQGRYNEETLALAQKMGYKTVFWSLAYADWDDTKAPSAEKAKELLCNNTHNGAVVLLHPTSNINVNILKDMIKYWKSEGYRFASLEELCKE